ncbi:MAG TPA: T9SS type A sorting domain-containing protein, partial [Rhodothermales bacterium]
GMYIPVSLSGDVSNVYSVELTATLDQELAEVVSVSGTKLPEGWQVSYAVSEGGELRIAMAGTSPLANAGEVARIAIRLLEEGAQVSVTAQGQINENGVAHMGEIAAREIPTEFELGSNYPNPFNPTTTFSYSLPETGKVTIQIFDITGRRVRVLVNEEKEAGIYKVQWDGRNDAGAQVASGMYLYQIRSGSFVDAKKMMLVK